MSAETASRGAGILLSLACLLIAPHAVAQIPPPPLEPPPSEVPPTTPPISPPVSRMDRIASQASANTQQMSAFKFDGTPLSMILQYYCDLTGRTPLQAPGIPDTKITLRSQSKLTIDEQLQAIETVLAMHNVALVKVGDKFLKVVPIATARQEGMEIRSGQEKLPSDTDQLVSELFHLEHIDTAEAQGVVQPLIHGYGKIQPLARINALLITDSAANIARLQDILSRVDQPIEIREEMRILPIRHTKASEIKKKLEEIIAQTQATKQEPQVVRPKSSGSPGVVARPPIPTPPGVIRATPTVPTVPRPSFEKETDEIESTQAERGIISGAVKIVADDRTGILIILTRPENMKFFENIVAALDVATEPDVLVKVIRLEYSEAETVAKMLNDLVGAASPKGSEAPPPGAKPAEGAPGTPDERTAAALQEYLRRQSQPSPAAPEKSKIGELTAANIKILSDKRSNAIIIMASKADAATISEIITAMDIMLSQVMIESVILEVNLDRTMETGMDWLQRSMILFNQKENGARSPVMSFAGSGGGGTLVPGDATAMNSSDSIPRRAGLSYYFTYYGLNLDAVLKLVASDSKTRILSSPVVLTTDNKKAAIDVSQESYFYKGQKYVATTTGQGTYVSDVETKKVGINLTVTPHINQKKFVVMEIVQKIENITGEQTIDGQPWPVVSSREMSASIAVRSGETIVLGGLVLNRESGTKSKIPFLGDLPLIGLAFGSRQKKRNDSEVVVFITPYVLDTPEEIMADASRRKEALHSGRMWTRGWSDSKLAEPGPGDWGTNRWPFIEDSKPPQKPAVKPPVGPGIPEPPVPGPDAGENQR